jgi:hypothetical protein
MGPVLLRVDRCGIPRRGLRRSRRPRLRRFAPLAPRVVAPKPHFPAQLYPLRACTTISDRIGTHHESQPKRSAGGFHAVVRTMQATKKGSSGPRASTGQYLRKSLMGGLSPSDMPRWARTRTQHRGTRTRTRFSSSRIPFASWDQSSQHRYKSLQFGFATTVELTIDRLAHSRNIVNRARVRRTDSCP